MRSRLHVKAEGVRSPSRRRSNKRGTFPSPSVIINRELFRPSECCANGSKDFRMLRTTGLFFVFAALVLGETQSGTVTSGGQQIPGATVVATCGADQTAAKITTITDDAGRFEMGGLPSTPCRFSVAIFGFEAPPREVA